MTGCQNNSVSGFNLCCFLLESVAVLLKWLMFISLKDSLLLNTTYINNYNVFVACLVLIASHFLWQQVCHLILCPLICKVPATITLISFTVPSSLPIKEILTLFIRRLCNLITTWWHCGTSSSSRCFPADNAVTVISPTTVSDNSHRRKTTPVSWGTVTEAQRLEGPCYVQLYETH